MSPPPDRSATAAEVARIVAGIANLTPEDRERLYLQLLRGRSPPKATTRSPNPSASVLPDPTSEPMRTPEVRTYLAEPGVKPEDISPIPRPITQRPPIDIRLYDLHGQYGVLGAGARKRIAQHMMKVDDWAGAPGSFESSGIRFQVDLSGAEPAAAAKASFPPRVVPVYILNEKKVGFEFISRVLGEHRYPEIIPGTNGIRSRERAEKEWHGGILGVTLPTHVTARKSRFVKCVFIKGEQLWSESRKNATYVSNIIIHEVGHAFGVFGGEHPTDDSVMQTRVSHAAMTVELRSYNKRHAQIIWSMINLLSRTGLVLAFVLAGAACPARRATQPSQCREIESAKVNCASCGRPSELSLPEAAQLTREILTRAISADREARAFIGGPEGPRYYRVNGGKTYIPGVATTKSIDDLNPLARAAPWKDFVFVDIEVLGTSGSDSIYVRVTVTRRSWMPDYERFGDDPGEGTYCLRQVVGGTVEVTVITPPIYLS